MASTIIVSWSEIDTARQCFMKHEKAYKMRWREPTIGPALQKGTLWHSVMDVHYGTIKRARSEGRLPDRDEMLEGILPLLYDEKSNQTEFQTLIEWMYTGYLEFYGMDPEWQIVAIEHPAEFWLPTPKGGRSRFKLKVKIDLIIKLGGRYWVVDHKSGKDLPKDKDLDWSDQFGLYVWGLRHMGKKVHGAIHSAARTQKNKSKPQPLDERFLRTPMYRTDAELDTIAVEAYKTARMAYSTPLGEAGRTPDEDRCSWRCGYTEPCRMSRKGVAPMDELLSDYGFVIDTTRH